MQDVDNYIMTFDPLIQERLSRVRALAHSAVPGAEEKMSYGVPTICDQKGKYIAYFAAYKNFVSIYPIHLGLLTEEMKKYQKTKSAAHFLHTEPLPEDTIHALFLGLYDAYKNRQKTQ